MVLKFKLQQKQRRQFFIIMLTLFICDGLLNAFFREVVQQQQQLQNRNTHGLMGFVAQRFQNLIQNPNYMRHNKKNSETAEPDLTVCPVAPFMLLDKEL